jgi:hypothetical protein
LLPIKTWAEICVSCYPAAVAAPHPSYASSKGCHQQAGSAVTEASELQPQREKHHGLPREAAHNALQHNCLQQQQWQRVLRQYIGLQTGATA